MNNIVLMGRLTKDPEIKLSKKTNKKFINFTIAVNKYKSKEANFIDCVAFNSIAEIINNNFEKGNRILLEGTLETYINNDKKKNVYVIVKQIQFIEKKKENITYDDVDFPF